MLSALELMQLEDLNAALEQHKEMCDDLYDDDSESEDESE